MAVFIHESSVGIKDNLGVQKTKQPHISWHSLISAGCPREKKKSFKPRGFGGLKCATMQFNRIPALLKSSHQ